jgi:hypothetical protein
MWDYSTNTGFSKSSGYFQGWRIQHDLTMISPRNIVDFANRLDLQDRTAEFTSGTTANQQIDLCYKDSTKAY